eukprot:4595942-Amphidinium_carterae.4
MKQAGCECLIREAPLPKMDPFLDPNPSLRDGRNLKSSTARLSVSLSARVSNWFRTRCNTALFFQGADRPFDLLIGGSMPGVSLAANQEQVSGKRGCMLLLLCRFFSVPRSTRSHNDARCSRLYFASLSPREKMESLGEEREHDADLSVFVYIYGGDAIEVRNLAKEVQLKIAETHVVRVKITRATVQPNVWVPFNGAKEVESGR